ncbi:MAG: STM4011 family radical SAM protein [Lachnospiraceae bacterium]
MRERIQLYYRGSLKNCNYRCSYCPFSKFPESKKQVEQDKQHFFTFVTFMEQQKDFLGAIQIVPYGEALQYEYYWEGLARLSRCTGIEAVGAQSNFSFPVAHMLSVFQKHGGKLEKLRLWGTFHPQLTTISAFLKQCESLRKHSILFSVGAVGDPCNLLLIQQLREKLPKEIYLWINRMDGLNRSYTKTEYQAFLEIDPLFSLECAHHPAEISRCQNAFFLNEKGDVFGCNLSKKKIGNLYQAPNIFYQPKQPKDCLRKECNCYLAYNNRTGEKRFEIFGTYPAFRIPVKKGKE